MGVVTICSDFGAPKYKACHCFHCFPIYLPWSDGTGCMIFVFWMLSFKPAFSLSYFTFINRLFSSSSLSAIRVISSTYLSLLIFLPAILIPACASSSLSFRITFLQFSSGQFSRSVMSDSLQPHESQHTRPPCPSPTPRVHPNSCPSSWWCHPAISSSVVPFSSCPQSLPASESFLISQHFSWGGQSIGVSASASVLPMNTQDWSPLGWTSWISLQSKEPSRVFSNTTVQKHQLFGAQLSSQSNSHIHTWSLEKP